MPDEQSVAPKERVNIRYKSDHGDAKEEVELPLKLLVVGDLTGRKDATPVEEREVVSVNKDTFNEVMAKQNISVGVSVPDRIGDKPNAEIAVDLKVRSLKDLEPDAIVQNVPELKRLYAIREVLKELKADDSKLALLKERLAGVLKDDAKLNELMSLLEGAE